MTSGRPEDLLTWLKPGLRVYLQGGPGECLAFADLLRANGGAARGVELWSCLIPGINSFDYGSLPEGPNVVTFMASTAIESSIASGRTQLRAMPYSQIGVLLDRTEFDLAILHVAPPDEQGMCSFGIACDAPSLVWPRARRRVAFLNLHMPRIPNADAIALDRIDLAIAIDSPLLSPSASSQSSLILEALAGNAAALVPDGAVIQSGIGEAPGAVVGALADRKRLRVHSGIVTEEYRPLANAGALDSGVLHVAGVAWGRPDFYRWLDGNPLLSFRSIQETHARDKLAAMSNFTSIGSAIEVDLAGNINLEWRGGRRISSVGGAPDYMHVAAASKGGRSIIALPSTAGNGASRIVTRLHDASIGADLADWIVTEHGAAHLRGRSAEARAEAMIRVAHPEHRPLLAAEWEPGRGR